MELHVYDWNKSLCKDHVYKKIIKTKAIQSFNCIKYMDGA